ncbi:hypothetical protein ASPZODRAFT_1256132 [Penicilliopsis zonata CBS 506.65]|uniref:Protein PXR1 n=1 Tax=Penicilliopsis zonata CBS 506.65 TaxID=1073090 RepID=A0A1L9S771_9EURO|nr:hypothetical protein ASPZODRAFT_1256132 [Penicilliopsis zonata CBS 506.65]OJJ43012.1 hypothetical protein ASPZODRAFT_1256132 [Penicilliopsis zonata CBS 506.65]
MGLAAPRKRTKISNDPNNTNWARSTSGYGQKILSSQGWAPGDLLGAKNAPHASMLTTASVSHIKVTIKDDTLGLGASLKRDAFGGPTGLDAFKGLLGRLNGKTEEELSAEQRKTDDIRLIQYAATKWQAVRFVSGGLLVQEKVKVVPVDVLEEDSVEDSPSQKSSDTGEKKKKKRRKEDARTEDPDDNNAASNNTAIDKDAQASDSDRRKSKKNTLSPSEDSKNIPIPKVSSGSKERIPMGRHVVRGRHIAQKKKALLDDKSLNEIFMIKS